VFYALVNVLKEATELHVKAIRKMIEEKALLLANIFYKLKEPVNGHLTQLRWNGFNGLNSLL
jgi:hypothetical protein